MMWEDYVWVASKKIIKPAKCIVEDDGEIVYLGRFLCYEEAKRYYESSNIN